MCPTLSTARGTGASFPMDRCVRVRFHNPTQMCLAQDNHMIDALASDRSDLPFSKAILPRRGWCNGPAIAYEYKDDTAAALS
jgi:hypothetical protein